MYQGSIAGVPLGFHVCPSCGAEQPIEPEQVLSAIDALLPAADRAEVRHRRQMLHDLAQHWYQTPDLEVVLRYKDVDLGTNMERSARAWLAELIPPTD